MGLLNQRKLTDTQRCKENPPATLPNQLFRQTRFLIALLDHRLHGFHARGDPARYRLASAAHGEQRRTLSSLLGQLHRE